MNIPFYEIGLVVAGVVGKSLLDLMLGDLYPHLKEYTKRFGTYLYQYTPHKMIERQKKAKRRRAKQEEILQGIRKEYKNEE